MPRALLPAVLLALLTLGCPPRTSPGNVGGAGGAGGHGTGGVGSGGVGGHAGAP